jgi:hypothetical protein
MWLVDELVNYDLHLPFSFIGWKAYADRDFGVKAFSNANPRM